MRKLNLGRGSAGEGGEGTTQVGAGGSGASRLRPILLVALLLLAVVAAWQWGYISIPWGPKPTPSTPQRPVAKAPVPLPAAAPTAPTPPVAKAPAPTPAPTPAAKAPATPAPEPQASLKPPAPTAAKPPAPAQATAAPPQPPQVAKAAPTPAPVAKGSFSVQVGAMAQEANAIALKKKLEGMGFEVRIRKGTVFGDRHVVSVGNVPSRKDAEALGDRLKADGFHGTVAAAGAQFAQEAGAFSNLNDAIDLARELQKKGYAPRIASVQGTTRMYQVRVGTFENRQAAARQGEELKRKGFNYLIVKN